MAAHHSAIADNGPIIDAASRDIDWRSLVVDDAGVASFTGQRLWEVGSP